MQWLRKLGRVELTIASVFFIIAVFCVLVTSAIFATEWISDAVITLAGTFFIYFLIRFSRKRLRFIAREYKSLFDKHPSPMWIFDITTLKFLAVNEKAIRQYGYSEKEFLSMSIKDIRPDEDVARIEMSVEAPGRREEKESIWRHKKKNGDLIVVHVVSNDLRFNKKRARLIEATDITELTTQQQQISKLSMVAEKATNGVIILDAENRIEWVNHAFENTTGFDLNEVQGSHPACFLAGTDPGSFREAVTILQAARRDGYTGDTINYKKGGVPFWVHLNVSPVIKEGVLRNIVVIQTDISALKDQSEKINAQYFKLRDIAFMSSHNARSQLTNILGLCDLADHQQTDEESKKLFTYIRASAVKLDAVIRTIVNQTTTAKIDQ